MRATWSRTLVGAAVVLAGAGGRAVAWQGLPKMPAAPGGAPDDKVEVLTGRVVQVVEIPLDPAEAAGLPAGSTPELLTPERVFAYAAAWDRGQGEAAPPRPTADDFARFRKAFLGGPDDPGARDPSGGYLGLLVKLQRYENARQATADVELVVKLITELVKGESSGLTVLALDQARDALQEARRSYADARTNYRDALDAMKVELGLAPRRPLAVDGAPLKGFHDTFEAVRVWFAAPDRTLDALPGIVDGPPKLDTPRIEGAVGLREMLGAPARGGDGLEALLGSAAEAARKAAAVGGAKRSAADEGRRELRVRGRVRRLLTFSENYEGARRSYLLAIRMMDRAFEDLVAPPAAPPAGANLLVTLLAQHRRVREAEDRLVDDWAAFRAEQIGLCRDLGVLPFDGWDGFLALFTTGHGPKKVAKVLPTPPAPPALAPPLPAVPVPPAAPRGPGA